MGSLLPGWDERAPGIAPREFQDFNENEAEEDHGYFARRSAASLARRSSSGAPSSSAEPRASPGGALLSRASLPAALGPSRSLTRAETMAAGDSAALLRPSLSGAIGGGGSAAAGGPHHLQRMYSMPATRGERSDVLAGLQLPTSPSAASSGGTPRSPLDAYRTHHADRDKPDYQWWRHFDSAAMNERPDEPVCHDTAFKPQFGVTGQGLHFHHTADVIAEEQGLSTIQAH